MRYAFTITSLTVSICDGHTPQLAYKIGTASASCLQPPPAPHVDYPGPSSFREIREPHGDMLAPLFVVAIRLGKARAALRRLGIQLSHHFATHSHPIGLSSLGEWVCFGREWFHVQQPGLGTGAFCLPTCPALACIRRYTNRFWRCAGYFKICRAAFTSYS